MLTLNYRTRPNVLGRVETTLGDKTRLRAADQLHLTCASVEVAAATAPRNSAESGIMLARYRCLAAVCRGSSGIEAATHLAPPVTCASA